MKPKVFISGGCSYSQLRTRDTPWPVWMVKALNPEKISYSGQGSQGNEFISRSVISAVEIALSEGYDPKDILVGVMWSGCDRMLYFSDTPETYESTTKIPVCESHIDMMEGHLRDERGMAGFDYQGKLVASIDEERLRDQSHAWHGASPTSIRNPNHMGHYSLNAHWEDEKTVGYFANYMNPTYAIMQTCEHILRTQWFLKMHGIPFFMTEYDFDVFTYCGPHGPVLKDFYADKYDSVEGASVHHNRRFGQADNHEKELEEIAIKDTHPEVNYLYKMIDKDMFLPVRHMHDWVNHVSEHDFPREGDPHPGSEQHKDFVDQVILPFILEKYNISSYNV